MEFDEAYCASLSAPIANTNTWVTQERPDLCPMNLRYFSVGVLEWGICVFEKFVHFVTPR